MLVADTPDSPAAQAAAMRARIQARLFAGQERSAEVVAGLTLQREIASGGSGDVFLAHDPRLDRLVAVKILRGAAHGAAELRRLHREARTLARLAHPNVVHVYEVGDHGGRLYLVMEYVAGAPLLDWQRDPGRTWQEVLRCYLDAASGLAAAHAVGIIHRDVKPANILVGSDRRVRVADFGLARPTVDTDRDVAPPAKAGPASDVPDVVAVDDDGLPELRTESLHARGGTPAYMAPETIRDGVAEPRSDQFSWAVSLYEGLYGRRPYTPAELGASSAPPLWAPPRRGPRRERVPRWLVSVVRRALAWDRESRFASMTEVIETIARASNRRSQRIRIGAVGTAVVASALVTWRLSSAPPRCPDPSGELAGVWDEAARTDGQSAFASTGLSYAGRAWERASTDIEGYAAAWQAARTEACDATYVRVERSDELFDLSRACLDVRRSALAAVSERLRSADAATVANAVALVSTLPEIEPCLDSTLLRLDPSFARHDGDQVERARLRQVVARVTAAAASGDQGSARELADQLATDARALGDDDITAEALFARGVVHQAAGRVAETLQDLSDAADAAEASRHDELKPQVLVALARASADLLEDGERATEYIARARASLIRIGRNPEDVPSWLEASAQVRIAAGDGAAAEALLVQALAIRRGDPDARTSDVASTTALLGSALVSAGRIDEADQALREARQLRAAAMGEDHPLVAVIDFSLGRLAQASGDLTAAARLLEQARANMSASYGADAPKLATVHLALGELATERAAYDEALAHATRALEIQASMERPERSVNAAARRVRANAYRALHEDARALAENREILRLEDRVVPELDLVPVLINIGHFACRASIDASTPNISCAEARSVFERALSALVESTDPEMRRLIPYVQKGLGKVEIATGNPNRALDYLEGARARAQEQAIVDPELTGELELAFARARLAVGDRVRAAEHSVAARAAFEQVDGDDPSVLAEVRAFERLLSR